MTTENIPQKPRYYIQRDELKYFWLKTGDNKVDLIQRFKRYPISTKENKVYLDILSQEIDVVFREVKLYLDNGQTQICLIPCMHHNFIHIENIDHLFDGRFNA